MSTSAKTSKPKSKPTQLDEEMSARVIAEYLVLGHVKKNEIDAILDEVGRSLSDREIALTFRLSKVLDIPAAFALSPLYDVARRVLECGDADDTRFVASLVAESICAGVEMDALSRESLLLSTIAAFWPDNGISGSGIDDVLDAIDRRAVDLAIEGADRGLELRDERMVAS